MSSPAVSSGVFPCYKNQFSIGTAGSGGATNPIADMTAYSIAINNTIVEWNAFENEGWLSRLMTGKDIKITVKGKRNIGDAGNNMVASCFHANGKDAERDVLWTFPDGATLLLSNAVINVTAMNSDEATGVGPLEWEALSNGKPTYTPAA